MSSSRAHAAQCEVSIMLGYGPWTHIHEVDRAGIYLGPAEPRVSVWVLEDGWGKGRQERFTFRVAEVAISWIKEENNTLRRNPGIN